MQEVVFNNPVFMKRLCDQLSEPAKTMTAGQKFVSDLFAVYLPILYFVGNGISGSSSMACKANAKALFDKANLAISSPECQQLCNEVGSNFPSALQAIQRGGF